MKLNFSQRASLYIMLLTTLLFGGTLAIVYSAARYYLYDKTMQEAERKLEISSQRINSVQTTVETITRNVLPRVRECLGDPQALLSLTEEIVSQNPLLASAGIGFKRNYFEGMEYYLPNSTRNLENDSIHTKVLTLDNYGDYFCMDWFQLPFLLRQTYWSEPYESTDGSPIVSHLSPVTNYAGETVGILSIDIRLYELTHQVNQDNDGTKSILIGRRGNILVDTDQRFIARETIFTMAETLQDSSLWNIGLNMVKGKSGMGTFTGLKGPSCLLYKPTGNIGWSTGIIIPESIIGSSIYSMAIWTIIATLCGLILTYVFCFLLIRRLTQPLKVLTLSANKISSGDFNTPLPSLTRNDEIKELCNAFGQMQHSLERLVSNLTVERDRAAHANRILSAFIQNTGRGIRTPLNAIVGFSSVIVEAAGHEQGELKQYAEIISSNCRLLDTLLNQLVDLSELESGRGSMNFIAFGAQDICTSVVGNIKVLQCSLSDHMPVSFQQGSEVNIAIETDPIRLEQLLANLMRSASNMEGCRQITLSYSSTEHPGHITFKVTSVGRSLSPEQAAELFKRFEHLDLQDDGNNSSLELYICHSIARHLHARLYVDTGYKEGNRFVLVHPLKR